VADVGVIPRHGDLSRARQIQVGEAGDVAGERWGSGPLGEVGSSGGFYNPLRVSSDHSYTGRIRLRIQPVSATFYALAREEDVANGIQTEDLLYGSSEGVMWDRWQTGDSLETIARAFERAIHPCSVSSRNLAAYVHRREGAQGMG